MLNLFRHPVVPLYIPKLMSTFLFSSKLFLKFSNDRIFNDLAEMDKSLHQSNVSVYFNVYSFLSYHKTCRLKSEDLKIFSEKGKKLEELYFSFQKMLENALIFKKSFLFTSRKLRKVFGRVQDIYMEILQLLKEFEKFIGNEFIIETSSSSLVKEIIGMKQLKGKSWIRKLHTKYLIYNSGNAVHIDNFISWIDEVIKFPNNYSTDTLDAVNNSISIFGDLNFKFLFSKWLMENVCDRDGFILNFIPEKPNSNKEIECKDISMPVSGEISENLLKVCIDTMRKSSKKEDVLEAHSIISRYFIHQLSPRHQYSE